MSQSLHEQLERIRETNNPVYLRMAEIAWEYISDQSVVDLGCRGIVMSDLAKLFNQVDRLANPDDDLDDDGDDEEVDLSSLSPVLATDSALLAPGGVS